MITKDQHSKLKDASHEYQNGAYELPQIESVMDDVFGDNRAGEDATTWSRYWTTLITFCERRDDGNLTIDEPEPLVCCIYR